MVKKVMKLGVLTSLAAISLTGSKAQTTTPVNNGGVYIRGGYNLSNISTSNDGSVNDSRALSTFHAGVIADLPVAPVLSVQTGLLLNGQGAKANWYLDNDDKSDNYVKSRFNPLYLQLPVNAVVKLPVSESTKFMFGAGPYIQMGIGGKSKIESSFAGIETSSSENIKFNDDDPTTGDQEGARYDRLKRFDAGINALAGFEIDRFMITANYGLGLTKINSTQTDNDENDKNKFRTFSVGAGFRL
ncbi:porin family protein [Parafilimonas sp.]|uniref:porin family protein n=1 Tax=Parafilimonas sp. TaxID=1969739 RepID=UPI0039E51CA5